MIDSIKDLHWDIRPSPHFGTVEVRVMDTPLTLSHAVNMAGLIQATAHWLLTERPFKHQEKITCCINSTVSRPVAMGWKVSLPIRTLAIVDR